MLDQTLQVVARSLAPELAPPEAMEPLLQIARQLPDALTHVLSLECRLGPGPAPVDLGLLVAEDAGLRVLAGTHPRVRLSATLAEHPAWRRLRELALLCNTAGSPLHARVQDMWLEFDGDCGGEGAPVPGVFFRVDRVAPDPSPYTLQPPARITEMGLSALRGEPLPPALRDAVGACLGHARGRAHLLHVGVFPARGVDAVRLFLYTVPGGGLEAFLRAAGSPGRVDEAAATARTLGGLADDLFLQVDVGATGLLPRIDIECHILDHPRPVWEARWARLLEHLVQRGACTPDRVPGLLAFRGVTVRDFFYSRAFCRGLHHVKVVLQPDRPMEAKAYLFALHRAAAAAEAGAHAPAAAGA